MSQRVDANGLTKCPKHGVAAKASVNSAFAQLHFCKWSFGDETVPNTCVWLVEVANVRNAKVELGLSFVSDPKPGELPMSRLNFSEMRREGRTRELCNILG